MALTLVLLATELGLLGQQPLRKSHGAGDLVNSAILPRSFWVCAYGGLEGKGGSLQGTWLRSATVVRPLVGIFSSMWHLGLLLLIIGIRVNTQHTVNVSVIDTLIIPFAALI